MYILFLILSGGKWLHNSFESLERKVQESHGQMKQPTITVPVHFLISHFFEHSFSILISWWNLSTLWFWQVGSLILDPLYYSLICVGGTETNLIGPHGDVVIYRHSPFQSLYNWSSATELSILLVLYYNNYYYNKLLQLLPTKIMHK